MIRGGEREREGEKAQRQRESQLCSKRYAHWSKKCFTTFFLANANTVIRRFVLLTYLQKARERLVDGEHRRSFIRRARDNDVIRECSNIDGALAILPVAFAFNEDDDDD